MRDALEEVAEKLTYERKDRAYERECQVEWEEFDSIDALMNTDLEFRLELTRARRELKHAQYEIRRQVQRLKESSSV